MFIMIDALIEKIMDKKNPTVVGLDTRLEYIPEVITANHMENGRMDLSGAAKAITAFNKRILDAVADQVAAVKIQMAYYEMYGVDGIRSFQETAAYAREKDLIVIADVKRGDIDATAAAYSAAYLGRTPLMDRSVRAFDTDFITVNPYLGSDGIHPFLEDCKRYGGGLFILVKTSNPSSGEFQDLNVGNRKLYEVVAEKVFDWGGELQGKYGYSAIGAVVGATYPEQGATLRAQLPGVYFLVPGYGAQGGGVEDIRGCFDAKGLGAVVNASRSILCAYLRSPWKDTYTPAEFDAAARAEVKHMKQEFDAGLARWGTRPW